MFIVYVYPKILYPIKNHILGYVGSYSMWYDILEYKYHILFCQPNLTYEFDHYWYKLIAIGIFNRGNMISHALWESISP